MLVDTEGIVDPYICVRLQNVNPSTVIGPDYIRVHFFEHAIKANNNVCQFVFQNLQTFYVFLKLFC